jgi:hypothetical protein
MTIGQIRKPFTKISFQTHFSVPTRRHTDVPSKPQSAQISTSTWRSGMRLGLPGTPCLRHGRKASNLRIAR